MFHDDGCEWQILTCKDVLEHVVESDTQGEATTVDIDSIRDLYADVAQEIVVNALARLLPERTV